MSGPLRVAMVGGSGKDTGVEAHLLALLASFDRAAVDPVLFTPGPHALVDQLRSRGVAVEFGAPTRKLDWSAARALTQRWANAFDLVHAHGPRLSFWALRAARQAAIPAFVITVHEMRWQNLPPGPKSWLWIKLEAEVMRKADHLIAVSDMTKAALVERYPDLEERTTVVRASAPILLEPERLPLAAAGRRDEGLFRIVTVGRFFREKGYDLLLPALAELKQSGIRFTVDVVGFGVLEEETKAHASRLALDGEMRWLGTGVNLVEVLSRANAFVTATRSEAFGTAVLEAMALGLPVLAPAVGGLTELIEDGRSGRLLPFDPEETLSHRLATVLAQWARDPEETRRLGESAARRARDTYGPARFAQGVTEVYRRVLEARRAAHT